MPDDSTPEPAPDIVSRYFEADKGRDTEAICRSSATTRSSSTKAAHGAVALRSANGDLAPRRRTSTRPRSHIDHTDDTHYRVSGRIDGNFPGATAELIWDFSTVEGLISCLKIAPP